MGSNSPVNEHTQLIDTWLPWGSDGREAACSAGDLGLIPGWEGPLEKGTAAHSSMLAREIPWMEKPGGLQSTGSRLLWTRLSD